MLTRKQAERGFWISAVAGLGLLALANRDGLSEQTAGKMIVAFLILTAVAAVFAAISNWHSARERRRPPTTD